MTTRGILYRDGALADGRSHTLEVGVSILVHDGRISWVRPTSNEGEAIPRDTTVIDASGSTFVPGLVDSHSHLVLAGGAQWINRIDDPPEILLEVAERNARLQRQSGVRWARDVGAPIAIDPIDGRLRALNLGVRDRWRDRPGYPYVRAAGAWLDKRGTMPNTGLAEASNADELVEIGRRQLDDGADLLKLYMDGPEPNVSPWSQDELRPLVNMAHDHGVKVTAHSGYLPGARTAVAAGVDSIEHGTELDSDVAREMAANGITLVTTLAVFRSWIGFVTTTRVPRFADPEGSRRVREQHDRALESARLAHAEGVRIAAGTDFGGGSTRANQLAWEVEALVDAGLQPWEALGSATWRGGELLGEPEAGVIREGGPADFSLVHGDPVADPSALWRVWHVAWDDFAR
jgi:imidazolonepropionase-like amidohydrolase